MPHTLAFLAPGHFHAALTLRERHPAVRDEVVVYASPGPELDAFVALVDSFNRRTGRPTSWRLVVRAGDDPLARLIAERPGDVVVLAGKNDRKLALVRPLHDAGFHVLADKPWLITPDALGDALHVLSGGARVMEIMTGRHEITSAIVERLVREPDVFGTFDTSGTEPAIRLASIHHLEKSVNGAPLRRPSWYFDVRVQGDGIADIPTHLVDQAQRLLQSHGAGDRDGTLLDARRWPTLVPRTVFARITGLADFPAELRDRVDGDALRYVANAELTFRLRGVRASAMTRWDLSEPPGGGDIYRATLRGTTSVIRLEQSADTGFARRVFVEPRRDAEAVRRALERAVATWPPAHAGLVVAPTARGVEIEIPASARSSHESHFPLVLDEFLHSVDTGGPWPDDRAADTLAKYALIADALERARDEPAG